MHENSFEKLDKYLKVVDARVRTSRRASEVFFSMPPLGVAIEGERLIKNTLDETYDGFVSDDENQPDGVDRSFEDIKAYYWSQASRVAEISGAKNTDQLDTYLHVTQDRSETSIREKIRSEYSVTSSASRLLDGIELYSSELGFDIMTAARFTTTHLKAQLPYMKRRAGDLKVEDGMTDVEATEEVFREFSEVIVPFHIQNKLEESEAVSSMRRFSNSIPKFEYDETTLSAPLRMKKSDAQGLAAVYKLERRPYDSLELAYAEKLAQEPIIQSTLLLFHMAIVDYSKEYLSQHPERMRHSLLPFSEFFVPTEENKLVPNPKLIQVLNNNYLPALAGIVLRGDIEISDITASHFAEAALEARKRRVFFAQIAKFNNYDADTDTVDLETFLSRTCPAMQVLTNSMATWLPKIYEHLRVTNPDRLESDTLF